MTFFICQNELRRLPNVTVEISCVIDQINMQITDSRIGFAVESVQDVRAPDAVAHAAVPGTGAADRLMHRRGGRGKWSSPAGVKWGHRAPTRARQEVAPYE